MHSDLFFNYINNRIIGGHGMRKLVFIACFGLILIIAACGGEEDAEEETEDVNPTPVEVEKVKTGDFKINKTIYGNTSPKKQQPIMVEQPGELKTLKVKNGDSVQKDEHLATVKAGPEEFNINAPTDGTVALLQTSEGSMTSNEEPLLVVADLDTMLVNIQVTAKARDLFKEEEELTVHIDEEKYQAKVTSIDALPGESGQYAIELEFDNKDEKVLAGEPAKVSVTEEKIKKTKIVPTEAILTEGDEQYVYIVRDHQAERVTVEVEETQSEESAVKAENLKKDDEVIVNGHFTLTDEAEVDVQDAEEED